MAEHFVLYYSRRADPLQVNPLLYSEMNDLKMKLKDLDASLEMEQQRRAMVSKISPFTINCCAVCVCCIMSI